MFISFVCTRECACGCVCYTLESVASQRTTGKNWFTIPHGFQGLNSGRQAWQKAPLLADSSCQPTKQLTLFKNNFTPPKNVNVHSSRVFVYIIIVK